MKIELDLHYIIETEECNIDYLVEIFKKLSKMILVEFVKTVLIVFADKYMKMEAVRSTQCDESAAGLLL